jgi:nicotinate-nucleotide adenylyltransferase
VTEKTGPPERIALGVIGGSFDPVHMGHLGIAEEARERFALDKVLFVPAAQPPHKGPKTAAAASDRLEMVRLATRGNPHFLVSDIEMHREGPSYTIDTLEQIRRMQPEARVYFIVGADSLAELAGWHRARELAERFDFIILARPGARRPSKEELAGSFGDQVARKLDGNFVTTGIFDISATEIRRRVREGRSIRYLVPAAVERYILSKGLYRSEGS